MRRGRRRLQVRSCYKDTGEEYTKEVKGEAVEFNMTLD